MDRIDPEMVEKLLGAEKDDELTEACAEMSKTVYLAAVEVFERLEGRRGLDGKIGDRKIIGNGHHAAQKLAQYAKAMVVGRWIKRIEKGPPPE